MAIPVKSTPPLRSINYVLRGVITKGVFAGGMLEIILSSEGRRRKLIVSRGVSCGL